MYRLVLSYTWHSHLDTRLCFGYAYDLAHGQLGRIYVRIQAHDAIHIVDILVAYLVKAVTTTYAIRFEPKVLTSFLFL